MRYIFLLVSIPYLGSVFACLNFGVSLAPAGRAGAGVGAGVGAAEVTEDASADPFFKVGLIVPAGLIVSGFGLKPV